MIIRPGLFMARGKQGVAGGGFGSFPPPLGAGKSYKLILLGDKGVTVAGGVVTNWADQSSNAYSAVPSTAGREPVVAAAFANGKDAIYFTAGKCLKINSFAISTSFTAFILADIDEANGWGYFIEQGGQVDISPGFMINNDRAHTDANLIGVNRGGGSYLLTVASVTELTNARALVVVSYDASTHTGKMKQAGVDLAQGAASGTPVATESIVSDTLFIGTRAGGNLIETTAWFTSIIICEGALSEVEIASVSSTLLAAGY